MQPILLLAMVAALGFHFAYCLVPSLRYFNARTAAYVLGVVAYVAVGVPPLLDLITGGRLASGPAYLVLAVAVLTIAAWRPYAFVRATGGPAATPASGARDPQPIAVLEPSGPPAPTDLP